MLALLIHIYYHDSWKEIFRNQLKELEIHAPLIMINLCVDIPGSSLLMQAIKKDFPWAYVIMTPNKGKDIGGKLALVDMFIKTKQDSKYIAFLHDKVSPHAITGERWRTKLFSIIQPGKIGSVIEEFQHNAKTGIIGAKDFIKNEYNEKKK